MFVDATRGRTKGLALAAVTGALALGACGDPEQNTDLRPEGPPQVLAVLVMTDSVAGLVEKATYCAPNDPKRPDSVGLPDITTEQVCSDDLSVGADMVTNAHPDGWYVRIMFDELLDPAVEDLHEIIDPSTGEGTDTYTGSIARTKPVLLECESINGGFVEVPYDGYYNPAGNRVTWPLGPSLVIIPDEPRAVATGKTCRVTLNDKVTDKDGQSVPEAQRGAYQFQIAPITPIFIDPSHGATVTAHQIWYDNVYVQFNTDVDASSFCDEGAGMDECEFSFAPLTPGDPPTPGTPIDGYAYSINGRALDSEFGFGPNDPLETSPAGGEAKSYRFAFHQGGKLKDRCGVETTFGAPSAADQTLIDFTTRPFTLTQSVPTDGDTVAPLRKPMIVFSNVVDFASLEASEFSIDPMPDSFTLSTRTFSDGDYVFGGHYQPDTEYVFTLKAGATIDDAYGVTYTQAEDRTIRFHTQPIALTATSPANNGRFTKATPASPTYVALVFNQSMDPATLDIANVEFSGGAAIGTPFASGCAPSSTSCAILIPTAEPLEPGDYTFTFKGGATIEDVLGNVYTQAADRVVNFTVANASSTAIQCL